MPLRPPPPTPAERLPLPPVPTHIGLPRLEFQETTFPLTDLRHYYLRERAALAGLGDELAAARDAYGEVKKLDETLFEKHYESL